MVDCSVELLPMVKLDFPVTILSAPFGMDQPTPEEHATEPHAPGPYGHNDAASEEQESSTHFEASATPPPAPKPSTSSRAPSRKDKGKAKMHKSPSLHPQEEAVKVDSSDSLDDAMPDPIFKPTLILDLTPTTRAQKQQPTPQETPTSYSVKRKAGITWTNEELIAVPSVESVSTKASSEKTPPAQHVPPSPLAGPTTRRHKTMTTKTAKRHPHKLV